MADSAFGLKIGDDAKDAAKDACRLQGAVDELGAEMDGTSATARIFGEVFQGQPGG